MACDANIETYPDMNGYHGSMASRVGLMTHHKMLPGLSRFVEVSTERAAIVFCDGAQSIYIC